MRGVISAGHKLTAEAGIEILKEGGNAFDAAVAASFASFVCESPLTSIGGGGFFMAHSKEGETLVYDFFPNAPGLGKKPSCDDLDFYPIEVDFTGTIQEFHVGRGAAAVPGCMAGLNAVVEKHCSLPLSVLLAPAIDFARNGIIMNAEQAYFKKLLTPILMISPDARKVYAPEGVMLKEGETVFKKDMANTMEYLAREGLHMFYRGDIAKKIAAEFSDGGLIREADLANYKVEVRKPVKTSYRGRDIFLNPPPSSSGGCLIAFSLKMLEKIDIASLGFESAQYMSLLYEMMRVTDDARGEDFDHRVYEEDIIETFLSPERIESYRKKMAHESSLLLGTERPSTGNTTHISVLDEAGNAASVTTSNGEGCGHMVTGMGIMLNNMLGEEDINPHGFHQHKPGMRMSSMMTPTIVMDGRRPAIVMGSGGSNRIRNAILQVIINLIDHKMDINNAVNSPRVHWDKKSFQVEAGIASKCLHILKSTGVSLNCWEDKNMYFGGVHTVASFGDEDGLSGAGDLRRGGVCLSTKG
ncbi:MAG: gamma-glutamyltransferase [Deltaproteobacteria bacterium]|nr:gamma-glutamyltransferase [Deltaproteobacteria bacterium]